MMFVDLPPALSQISSGKVRAIAVSTPQRTGLLPAVPTVGESVPGFEFSSWAGLLVPAGTPAEIVNRLHAEVVSILNLPEVKQQFTRLGAEPVCSTPQQFAELIRSETARWSKVVKDSGAKVD
jgi:tripartite-type tricarboxylate transporter receptor subunit TctC